MTKVLNEASEFPGHSGQTPWAGYSVAVGASSP
jgi:hypothetical protein